MRSTDPEYRIRARLLALMILIFGLVAVWTISPRAVRAAMDRIETEIGRKPDAARKTVPARQTQKPDAGA